MQGVRANDLAIRALKPRQREYEVSVREHRGLIVVVYPSGAKSFALRYRQDGILKRVRLSTPTLAAARAEWQSQRDVLKSGDDPSAKVRSARVNKQLKRQATRAEPTIEQLVADYIETYAKKRKRSWRADELMLQGTIVQEWGGIKAKEIKRRDVIDMLDRIAERTPVRANRVLAVVRKMYNWAVEKRDFDHTPCAGVKSPGAEKSRERVLSDDEIRKFWNEMKDTNLPPRTQIALKLQLASAQRLNEVLGAPWTEFDTKKREWLIAGKRTKNGLETLVPLSSLAMELLEQLDQSSKVLFPAGGKTGILRVDVVTHDLADAIKKLEMEHFTSHDLRRTAGTGFTSLGTSRTVMDAILNHKDRTVGGIYDRYKYAREKRAALEVWAKKLVRIVSGTESKVTPLRRIENPRPRG